MTLRPVCAGIEQGCGRWQVSRETKGSNWNLVVGGGVYPSSPCVDRAVDIAPCRRWEPIRVRPSWRQLSCVAL